MFLYVHSVQKLIKINTNKNSILAFPCFRYSPSIFLLIFVEQRLEFEILLMLRQFRLVSKFEEARRKLYQPFRIDRGRFAHIFFGCGNDFMVNNPFWLTIEQC